jgi:hypothetical protein
MSIFIFIAIKMIAIKIKIEGGKNQKNKIFFDF